MQQAGALSLPGSRARQRWLMLPGIILLAWFVYAASPVTTSTDSAWTFHVAASILRQGNIDLDEYRGLMDLRNDYRLRVVDGHIYSYYPVATPAIVTPAVWLVNQVYPLIYHGDFYSYLQTHGPDTRTARLEKLLASAIVAMAAGVMYLVARQELGSTASVALAAIFAFGTSMWSTASRALWQHGPSALLLALALWLLVRRPPLRGRDAFLVGLVLGLAYLVRPTNALAVGFVGLYLLLNRARLVPAYVSGLALLLVPFLAQNLLTYGNLLPPYSYQLFERLGSARSFLEALAGTLISPARGLFVWTPVFLFAIWGIVLRLRGAMTRANLSLYLAGILLMHWVVTALFEDWGGAWSIGPRYFVDVIPLLAYFLIPVLRDWMLLGTPRRAAFIVAAGLGLLIQLHCSTSIYPFMWNGKPRALVEAPERKWDWGDLQFLRGFCATDPLEGRAPACWLEPNG